MSANIGEIRLLASSAPTGVRVEVALPEGRVLLRLDLTSSFPQRDIVVMKMATKTPAVIQPARR